MVTKQDYVEMLGLVKDPVQSKGSIRILDFIEPIFFLLKAAKGHHQGYDGGLADHTFLVMLDAYYEISVKSFYLDVSPDDVILAAFFHDLDKIPRYAEKENIQDAYK